MTKQKWTLTNKQQCNPENSNKNGQVLTMSLDIQNKNQVKIWKANVF